MIAGDTRGPDAGQPGAFTRDLPALRSSALLNAPAAARYLNNRLARPARWSDPADYVDAHVLHAEALLRAGFDDDAYAAAATAEHAARCLAPVDWPRLRTAWVVAADIGHLIGKRGTADCAAFLDAVADREDPDRDVWTYQARGLLAVTIFHGAGCAEARRMLTTLHQDVREERGDHDPIAATIAVGLVALERACAGIPTPRPDELLPPTPGACLQPDVTQPHPGWLARRLTARRGRHDHTGRP
jgi:hypothetical protein